MARVGATTVAAVETSPPAPAPGAPVAGAPTIVHRPGQLTTGWRLTTLVTWALVFVASSGVWKASRELGIGTWWLGPVGSPRPFFVMVLPFIAPAVMAVVALNNTRRLPWFGLAASGIGAVIGIVDLAYIRRLGVVEILIACAAAAVSIASFSGMYRAAGHDADTTVRTLGGTTGRTERAETVEDAEDAEQVGPSETPCGSNSPAG